MSGPSSGIGVSARVRDVFLNGNDRFIKVQISEELSLEVTATLPESGSFSEDLNNVGSLLDQTEPCFILARTDLKNERDQFRWNLFSYVPDRSIVKKKMVYASTRASLKQQLGDDFFTDEIFGTVPGDFSARGYQSFIKHKEADDPLTREEEKIKEEREQGIFVGGGGTGGAYAHGIAFPVDDDVNQAMDNLYGGSVNYVQVTIDVDAERVCLCESTNITLSQLGSFVPNNEPRFHFFKYVHEYDGENFSSLVYVYSCPDGSRGTISCPVKMRMLFSSSKANVASLASSRGGNIDLKMEVNNGEDVAENEINLLLHPAKAETKKIKKPTPRGGRKFIR